MNNYCKIIQNRFKPKITITHGFIRSFWRGSYLISLKIDWRDVMIIGEITGTSFDEAEKIFNRYLIAKFRFENEKLLQEDL